MIKKRKTHRRRLKNPLNEKLSELYFGFIIKNSDDKFVGNILSVINYGASDILIFRNLENKELMIPLTDLAILRIDTTNKEIMIDEEYAT